MWGKIFIVGFVVFALGNPDTASAIIDGVFNMLAGLVGA